MKFENITKRYGKKQVFGNFSLEIEDKKITAILGESGSGKTTLLNMVASLTDYEGKIEGVSRPSYVFQSPALLPNLTVEGNLKFVLPKNLWSGISKMLEEVGLEGREKDYPSSLSGGEAQRVALVRAMMFPSDAILLDEPFSSLDAALKIKLMSLFVSLWQKEKRTVLFVTHSIDEAMILSHKIILLSKGGATKEFLPEGEIPRVFGQSTQMKDEILRNILSQEKN